MTQASPPPVDPGNPLLGPTATTMQMAIMETPQGQRLALTIRTPASTTTVFLNGEEARNWAAGLTRMASMLSASGLIVANGHPRVSGDPLPG